MISHHLPDGLLEQRVSGVLPEAIDLLVATHLSLCPRCRREEEALEAAAGAVFAAAPAVPADEAAGLASVLARLDAPLPADAAAPPPHPELRSDPLLPGPLLQWLGPSDQLAWATTVPGVASRVVLPPRLKLQGNPVTLERVRPGKSVPAHGHTGLELTLVLAGGYEDGSGHFLRGDVQAMDAGEEHRLHIDSDEPCILLSLHTGDRVARSVSARIARWLGAL